MPNNHHNQVMNFRCNNKVAKSALERLRVKGLKFSDVMRQALELISINPDYIVNPVNPAIQTYEPAIPAPVFVPPKNQYRTVVEVPLNQDCNILRLAEEAGQLGNLTDSIAGIVLLELEIDDEIFTELDIPMLPSKQGTFLPVGYPGIGGYIVAESGQAHLSLVRSRWDGGTQVIQGQSHAIPKVTGRAVIGLVIGNYNRTEVQSLPEQDEQLDYDSVSGIPGRECKGPQ